MENPHYYRGTASNASYMLYPREVDHLLWFVDPQEVNED
jgi:hypothetical protein